ncbi:TPA: site-specific integrase [Vibrio cholerae]|uniref:site-specific integrase n=1 Tax=Vibrio cholerae TaxID=666 RepID=UPI001B810BDB|nr:site-specific integrase [Vibrio cholerae]HBC3848725.1 site-specific integrase [Vibrio cholerae]HDI3133211.1 site-specific integrase [Vibrio cholerae]
MSTNLSKTQSVDQSWSEMQILVTREGKTIDISGDQWLLPIVIRGHSTLDFGKVSNLQLKNALKHYVSDQVRRTSTSAGYKVFRDVWRLVLRDWGKDNQPESAKDHLIDLFENSINIQRTRHKLWTMYMPIRWYIWCSDNISDSTFSDAYAAELEAMVIPGGPKGEAVRMSDPDMGPLHKSLELPLLIAALKEDKSLEFEHLQQKAVMALSLAFGRNPANLTYLREGDLVKLAPSNEDPCYIIRMPRIKKRFVNPRDDLMDEYLDPHFGRILENLVEKNNLVPLSFKGKDFSTPENRPLLIKTSGNRVAMHSLDLEHIFNMTSGDISRLITAFTKRHNIISPLTGELMYVTPRRLRYTLATGLATEGISKRELARILDHTDTQHVGVYFDVAGAVVEHLDKSMAKGFSKYLNFFKGKLIDNDEDAINGERDDKHLTFVDEQNPDDQSDIGVCGESSVCHLDPPYSCYLCPKFQPYRHADHEHVLECLLVDREERLKKYENARLGIQLDEVIAAVAQVAQLCEEGGSNV